MDQKYSELEDRLVDFTCNLIGLAENLPTSRSGDFIAAQLIASCHAPTFNYGEAQAADSRDVFILHMNIVLKELKDCRTALKIIRKREMVKPAAKIDAIFEEAETLIAIVGKSVSTARKNKAGKEGG